jgi:hypothetical protein
MMRRLSDGSRDNVNQQQHGMNAVLRLARSDIKTFRTTFAITGGFMLLMGTLVATIVSLGAIGPSSDIEGGNSILADLVMLMLAGLLATPHLTWGALSEWRNPLERRLALVRAMPIPVSTIVGSRMVFMLSALVITVPAFFAPIYLLGNVRLSFGAFVAFVAFWVGYALGSAGLTMYVDMVRGSRFFFLSSFGTAGALLAVVVLVSFILGFRIVYEIAELAISHGLVLGLGSLIVGALAFILTGRLTTRHLPGREIPV